MSGTGTKLRSMTAAPAASRTAATKPPISRTPVSATTPTDASPEKQPSSRTRLTAKTRILQTSPGSDGNTRRLAKPAGSTVKFAKGTRTGSISGSEVSSDFVADADLLDASQVQTDGMSVSPALHHSSAVLTSRAETTPRPVLVNMATDSVSDVTGQSGSSSSMPAGDDEPPLPPPSPPAQDGAPHSGPRSFKPTKVRPTLRVKPTFNVMEASDTPPTTRSSATKTPGAARTPGVRTPSIKTPRDYLVPDSSTLQHNAQVRGAIEPSVVSKIRDTSGDVGLAAGVTAWSTSLRSKDPISTKNRLKRQPTQGSTGALSTRSYMRSASYILNSPGNKYSNLFHSTASPLHGTGSFMTSTSYIQAGAFDFDGIVEETGKSDEEDQTAPKQTLGRGTDIDSPPKGASTPKDTKPSPRKVTIVSPREEKTYEEDDQELQRISQELNDVERRMSSLREGRLSDGVVVPIPTEPARLTRSEDRFQKVTDVDNLLKDSFVVRAAIINKDSATPSKDLYKAFHRLRKAADDALNAARKALDDEEAELRTTAPPKPQQKKVAPIAIALIDTDDDEDGHKPADSFMHMHDGGYLVAPTGTGLRKRFLSQATGLSARNPEITSAREEEVEEETFGGLSKEKITNLDGLVERALRAFEELINQLNVLPTASQPREVLENGANRTGLTFAKLRKARRILCGDKEPEPSSWFSDSAGERFQSAYRVMDRQTVEMPKLTVDNAAILYDDKAAQVETDVAQLLSLFQQVAISMVNDGAAILTECKLKLDFIDESVARLKAKEIEEVQDGLTVSGVSDAVTGARAGLEDSIGTFRKLDQQAQRTARSTGNVLSPGNVLVNPPFSDISKAITTCYDLLNRVNDLSGKCKGAIEHMEAAEIEAANRVDPVEEVDVQPLIAQLTSHKAAIKQQETELDTTSRILTAMEQRVMDAIGNQMSPMRTRSRSLLSSWLLSVDRTVCDRHKQLEDNLTDIEKAISESRSLIKLSLSSMLGIHLEDGDETAAATVDMVDIERLHEHPSLSKDAVDLRSAERFISLLGANLEHGDKALVGLHAVVEKLGNDIEALLVAKKKAAEPLVGATQLAAWDARVGAIEEAVKSIEARLAEAKKYTDKDGKFVNAMDELMYQKTSSAAAGTAQALATVKSLRSVISAESAQTSPVAKLFVETLAKAEKNVDQTLALFNNAENASPATAEEVAKLEEYARVLAAAWEGFHQITVPPDSSAALHSILAMVLDKAKRQLDNANVLLARVGTVEIPTTRDIEECKVASMESKRAVEQAAESLVQFQQDQQKRARLYKLSGQLTAASARLRGARETMTTATITDAAGGVEKDVHRIQVAAESAEAAVSLAEELRERAEALNSRFEQQMTSPRPDMPLSARSPRTPRKGELLPDPEEAINQITEYILAVARAEKEVQSMRSLCEDIERNRQLATETAESPRVEDTAEVTTVAFAKTKSASKPQKAGVNRRLAILSTSLSAIEQRKGSKSRVAALTDPPKNVLSKNGLLAQALGQELQVGPSLAVRAVTPLPSIIHAYEELQSTNLQLVADLNDAMARLKGVTAHYRRLLAAMRAGNMSSVPAHVAGLLRDALIPATRQLRGADSMLPDPGSRVRMVITKAFVADFNDAVQRACAGIFNFERAYREAKARMDEITAELEARQAKVETRTRQRSVGSESVGETRIQAVGSRTVTEIVHAYKHQSIADAPDTRYDNSDSDDSDDNAPEYMGTSVVSAQPLTSRRGEHVTTSALDRTAVVRTHSQSSYDDRALEDGGVSARRRVASTADSETAGNDSARRSSQHHQQDAKHAPSSSRSTHEVNNNSSRVHDSVSVPAPRGAAPPSVPQKTPSTNRHGDAPYLDTPSGLSRLHQAEEDDGLGDFDGVEVFPDDSASAVGAFVKRIGAVSYFTTRTTKRTTMRRQEFFPEKHVEVDREEDYTDDDDDDDDDGRDMMKLNIQQRHDSRDRREEQHHRSSKYNSKPSGDSRRGAGAEDVDVTAGNPPARSYEVAHRSSRDHSTRSGSASADAHSAGREDSRYERHGHIAKADSHPPTSGRSNHGTESSRSKGTASNGNNRVRTGTEGSYKSARSASYYDEEPDWSDDDNAAPTFRRIQPQPSTQSRTSSATNTSQDKMMSPKQSMLLRTNTRGPKGWGTLGGGIAEEDGNEDDDTAARKEVMDERKMRTERLKRIMSDSSLESDVIDKTVERSRAPLKYNPSARLIDVRQSIGSTTARQTASNSGGTTARQSIGAGTLRAAPSSMSARNYGTIKGGASGEVPSAAEDDTFDERKQRTNALKRIMSDSSIDSDVIDQTVERSRAPLKYDPTARPEPRVSSSSAGKGEGGGAGMSKLRNAVDAVRASNRMRSAVSSDDAIKEAALQRQATSAALQTRKSAAVEPSRHSSMEFGAAPTSRREKDHTMEPASTTAARFLLNDHEVRVAPSGAGMLAHQVAAAESLELEHALTSGGTAGVGLQKLLNNPTAAKLGINGSPPAGGARSLGINISALKRQATAVNLLRKSNPPGGERRTRHITPPPNIKRGK